MDSIEIVKAMVSWGMSAEYSKIQASSFNIANINKPGATFQATNFSKALAEMNSALNGARMEELLTVARQSSQIESIPETAVALDGEIEKLVSAQTKFEVLAEIYQRRSSLKSVVLGSGG